MERRIAATVLTFNNHHGLAEVMRRLNAQTRPPDQIIVVDNGSFPPAACDQRPEVRLIRNEANLGVGGGHNVAIRAALDGGADAVWILEHDTFPDFDCLERLLDVLDEMSAGAVAPDLARNNWERVTFPGTGDVHRTERFTLNGLLIDRHVIEQCGLLNEHLFVGMEDWEYSSRLQAAGVSVFVLGTPAAIHAHRGVGRLPSWESPSRLYYAARNAIYLSAPASRRRRMAGLEVAKGIVECVRPRRGVRFALARWWAACDALYGRMGRRAHSGLSG